jgi:hypothetical protein
VLALVQDMVAALNDLGVGNAEIWLKKLRFAEHQAMILEKINGLLLKVHNVLAAVKTRVGILMPASLLRRVEALMAGLKRLEALIVDHIPDAIKKLDSELRELQALLHSGGETTSKAASHAIEPGATNVTYTDQLILFEGHGAVRSSRGGLAQNSGLPSEVAKTYKYEPGFPNLLQSAPTPNKKVFHQDLTTFAGQIVNRELQPGEEIFRAFGPGDKTHGIFVEESFAAGGMKKREPFGLASEPVPKCWGLNDVPKNAQEWRKNSAVLDEWNRDGFIVIGKVLPGRPPIRACTGKIAEQAGQRIGIQYLEGGGKQAMITFSAEVTAELNKLGQQVQATKTATSREIGGIAWEIHPTGWPDTKPDTNGVHGYLHMPGPGTVQTVRLGTRELSSRREEK